MKKNIAIIILSITTILGFFYSFAQRTIAIHSAQLAEKQIELAMMYADSAAVARERAELQRMNADDIMRELKKAYAKLEECK